MAQNIQFFVPSMFNTHHFWHAFWTRPRKKVITFHSCQTLKTIAWTKCSTEIFLVSKIYSSVAVILLLKFKALWYVGIKNENKPLFSEKTTKTKLCENERNTMYFICHKTSQLSLFLILLKFNWRSFECAFFSKTIYWWWQCRVIGQKMYKNP